MAHRNTVIIKSQCSSFNVLVFDIVECFNQLKWTGHIQKNTYFCIEKIQKPIENIL